MEKSLLGAVDRRPWNGGIGLGEFGIPSSSRHKNVLEMDPVEKPPVL